MNGFWETILEPLPDDEGRFSTAALEDALHRAEVSLRGWNYPHVGRQIKPTANKGLESVTNSQYGHEGWILHSSGLFVHRMAMREDREPRWHGTLDLINALWSMTEIWEFTKRLYRDEPKTTHVRATVTITGLLGRRLRMDPQYSLPMREPADADAFTEMVVISQARLASEASEQALQWSETLFAQMGAIGIDAEVLRQHQERLLKRQF